MRLFFSLLAPLALCVMGRRNSHGAFSRGKGGAAVHRPRVPSQGR